MKTDFSKIEYLKKVSDESNKYSFNKGKKLKNSAEVFYDLIQWYFKNQEVDRTYFLRGNDIVGSNSVVYPTRLCVKVRDSFNGMNTNNNYTILLRDKALFGSLCSLNNIRTPKTFASSNDGILQWIDKPSSNTPIFIKEKKGIAGSSLYAGNYAGNNYIDSDNRKIKIDTICNKNDIIIQEKIRQIKYLNNINKNAVNTLKLTTSCYKNEVKIHFGFMRFGTTKSGIMDSFGSGSILVPIDVRSGILKDIGYYKYAFNDVNNLGYTKYHPDTNQLITNIKLPLFEESCDLVKQAHKVFSNVYSIGWDVALTDKGPVIIEGNPSWDTAMGQVVAGSSIIEEFFKEDPRINQFKKDNFNKLFEINESN